MSSCQQLREEKEREKMLVFTSFFIKKPHAVPLLSFRKIASACAGKKKHFFRVLFSSNPRVVRARNTREMGVETEPRQKEFNKADSKLLPFLKMCEGDNAPFPTKNNNSNIAFECGNVRGVNPRPPQLSSRHITISRSS